MITQLKPRVVIVYAPWIFTFAAAQYFANALGEMYTSNVLSGTITIPADPMYRLGSLCEVLPLSSQSGVLAAPLPGLLGTPSPTEYYISSISYQLIWAQQWTMTLGLAYGRASSQSFPYTGAINAPVLTDNQVNPNLYSPGTQVFTLQVNPQINRTQSINTIFANPAAIIPFSLVSLLGNDGLPVGPSTNGNYTVVPMTGVLSSVIQIGSGSKNPPSTVTFQYLRAGKETTPIASGFGGVQLATLAGGIVPSAEAAVNNPANAAAIQGNIPSAPLTGQYNTSSGITFDDGTKYPTLPNQWVIPIGTQGLRCDQSFWVLEAFNGGYIHHNGVDLVNNLTPTGNAFVYSSGFGVVTWCFDHGDGFGTCVHIWSDKYIHFYGHLDVGSPQQFGITIGKTVTPGQIIGIADSTGNSSGNHLHYGIMTLSNSIQYNDDNSQVATVVNNWMPSTTNNEFAWFYSQYRTDPTTINLALQAVIGNQ